MKTECTHLFLSYREIAAEVWNRGFWPHPQIRDWSSVAIFQEVMARLFEGIVLGPLGYQGRIEDKWWPGAIDDFRVEVVSQNAELLINKNLPSEPGGLWGQPTLRIARGHQQLRFLAFFDWYQLAPRDFRMLQVVIEQFEDHPELVGHHGLIELAQCSIWLLHNQDAGNGSA